MTNKMVNEIKPAYTYYLEKHIGTIRALGRKEDTTKLVKYLNKITKNAADTYVNKNGKTLNTKKDLFLSRINVLPNKAIVSYCECSIKKARSTRAKYNNL